MTDDREGSELYTQLGSYRLVRKLARGRVGVVYLAERADEVIRKKVVIRFIRLEEGSSWRDELADKVKPMLALDHQQIARFITSGHTEDGYYYLVREYVDGQPLDRYCNERGLSIDERLRLFQQVCEAVKSAHQNLVSHLALKPSDILVTSDGIPKVLDFGIAALPNVEATEIGPDPAPEYAGPERRRNAKTTAASDVYSLGAILYELLTNHRPVTADGSLILPSSIVSGHARRRTDNGEKEMRPDVIAKFRGETLGGLRRRLSDDLDQIVLMALRREPEGRYADAAELARDLERHLTKFPVIARPKTWGYRIKKFIRRYPIRVSVGALFLVFATNSMLLQREMRLQTGVVLTKDKGCCKAAHQFTEKMRTEIENEISTLPGGEPVSSSLLKKMAEFECGERAQKAN